MFLLRILFRLYNLYLSPDKALARRVLNMTGFVPARLSVFKLAFSHKSSQVGREPGQTNNERLEYLGDAVLGTVVADYLFKKYPNADEGFLTKMRSKIVKRKSLNYIGDQMGLNLLLSEYNRTRLSSSMLGNAVEALVGAVYLEKGYAPTKRFVVQRILKLYVDVHELETVDDNFKSQLLEACQREGKTVGYQLVNKYKQDRRDRFQVAVVINGEQVATADDFNKKAAEQLASLKALQKLNLIEPGTLPTGAHLATPDTEPQRVSRKSKSEKSGQGESAGRKPVRERAGVAEPSAERSRGSDSADGPASVGKRRGPHSTQSPSTDEVSRRNDPAPPADQPESEALTRRPTKISFAEATALVAAERAYSDDRSRHPEAVTPHAADLGNTASSSAERPGSLSDDERTERKSASRRRDKKRSPTTYLNRHAVRGAAAVAHLLDGFDFSAGSFAPHAPAVLAKAPHPASAPETTQPANEVLDDRLSPNTPSHWSPDAQDIRPTEGESLDEAPPRKSRSSRRKTPRPSVAENNPTPTSASEPTGETEVPGLDTSSETPAPTSPRRRARNRPQPPIAKHTLRKIVADAGAGLVAANSPDAANDAQPAPRPPKPARKNPRERRQLEEAAAGAVADAGQVAPTVPAMASHVGIEFIVTEKSKSRSRRKSTAGVDPDQGEVGDRHAEVDVDLTQSTSATADSPVIDLTGFVHGEQEVDTLPNGSVGDAAESFPEPPSPEPARKAKASPSRRRRAPSTEEGSAQRESEAANEAQPGAEADLPDGGSPLSWEDTLLELSFPELAQGQAADDARLTDSRNRD